MRPGGWGEVFYKAWAEEVQHADEAWGTKTSHSIPLPDICAYGSPNGKESWSGKPWWFISGTVRKGELSPEEQGLRMWEAGSPEWLSPSLRQGTCLP